MQQAFQSVEDIVSMMTDLSQQARVHTDLLYGLNNQQLDRSSPIAGLGDATSGDCVPRMLSRVEHIDLILTDFVQRQTLRDPRPQFSKCPSCGRRHLVEGSTCGSGNG